MSLASAWYLGVTLLLFLVFAAIVARTYRRKRKEREEAPKYRMMNDD
jgi:cbb3-type cytochrome oxidase subunit 3